jgi:hypothetical protein
VVAIEVGDVPCPLKKEGKEEAITASLRPGSWNLGFLGLKERDV